APEKSARISMHIFASSCDSVFPKSRGRFGAHHSAPALRAPMRPLETDIRQHAARDTTAIPASRPTAPTAETTTRRIGKVADEAHSASGHPSNQEIDGDLLVSN